MADRLTIELIAETGKYVSEMKKVQRTTGSVDKAHDDLTTSIGKTETASSRLTKGFSTLRLAAGVLAASGVVAFFVETARAAIDTDHMAWKGHMAASHYGQDEF